MLILNAYLEGAALNVLLCAAVQRGAAGTAKAASTTAASADSLIDCVHTVTHSRTQ